MSDASYVATAPLQSVRTREELSSCPVCHVVPLRGRQTVCSPRCRVKRWRERQQLAQTAKEREIRELLAQVLRRLEEL